MSMHQPPFQGDAPFNGLRVTGVPPPRQPTYAYAMNASTSPATRPVFLPKSPTTTIGGLRMSEPPNPDYMGDEISFVLPSLADFEQWRADVERTLTVDFVKGDKHSSRSSPKAFLELVKLVCARHSRSGRKPYEKKHPERQRKVPSRKVDEGCPATISYRTFEEKEEVHVTYNPRHSHVTGPENYEFTREGRREAAAHRSTRSISRSPQVMLHAELRDDWASTEAPTAPTPSFSSPYGIPTPLSAPSLCRPLPSVNQSPRTIPPEGLQYSPVSGTPAVSPIRPALGLSSMSSPGRPFDMQPLPYSPVSESVSPARSTHSLPTPITGTHALPPQQYHTPIRLPQPLPTPTYSTKPLPTPTYTTQPLPSPVRTTHALGTPLHVTQPLASPIHPPRPLYTPQHVTQQLPSPAVHTQQFSTPAQQTYQLPQSVHSTPLNVSTDLPFNPEIYAASPYHGSGLELQTESHEQHYTGTASGLDLSGSTNPDALTVPDGGPISLVITASPSPHPVSLPPDDPYSGVDDAMSSDNSPTAPPGNEQVVADVDMRADRWRRIESVFKAVQGAYQQVPYTDTAVYALETALMELFAQAYPSTLSFSGSINVDAQSHPRPTYNANVNYISDYSNVNNNGNHNPQ
ncbi:hypothetical protein AURDEDRAFT_181636 [Auricularia subglabra TFB-10046 SS5]|nr:hypothetical protein AURDEDRAFT_181636 [Auricularia subglabra TFB-10046 SS5]